jgi:hypothetical protein
MPPCNRFLHVTRPLCPASSAPRRAGFCPVVAAVRFFNAFLASTPSLRLLRAGFPPAS